MAMNGGTWFGGVFNSLALLVKNKKKKEKLCLDCLRMSIKLSSSLQRVPLRPIAVFVLLLRLLAWL